MDNLVASTVGLSGSAADLGQLHTQLKNAAAVISQTPPAALVTALQQLDPSAHSLGFLYLLEQQAKTLPAGVDAAFIDNVARFLQLSMASQVQMAPELFALVCRKFKDQVIAAGCPRKGILPLKAAIALLQPSQEHLTPVHADFLQLCVLSKIYNAAAEVLEADMFEVDPTKTAISVTDFYLYCYLGGMICIGRKRYARALELFLQALTAPTLVGNAIVVACHKKYVLAALIHLGTVPALPKFTPSRVKQVLETESRPYTELATAYNTHAPERLRRVADQHASAYNQDGNLGLVKQVIASLTKRNIQRLTQTYLTLPLGDIAQNVGLSSAADAEAHILRMVGGAEIHARILEQPGAAAGAGAAGASSSGVVRFLADPEQYDNPAVADRINDHIQKCTLLTARLQAVNDQVTLDRSYVTKVTAKERSRYGLEAQGGSEDLAAGLFQP